MLTLIVAILIAAVFLLFRLGADFDGLWRTRRPYFEAAAAAMLGVSLVGFFCLGAWLDGGDDVARLAPRVLTDPTSPESARFVALAHPWLAGASGLLLLGVARWSGSVEVVRPKHKPGHCLCGYPIGFSVCPECGRGPLGRRPLAEIPRHRQVGCCVTGLAVVLALAAVATYSPS